MPLTIPEGGRSIFAGRTEDEEEEEVVVVTSGGAEKLSKRGENKTELYGIISKNEKPLIWFNNYVNRSFFSYYQLRF